MPNAFSRVLERITGWYDKNFTWRGLLAFVLWIIVSIPDWAGRRDFWRANVGMVRQFAVAHSQAVLLAVFCLLIWLDHRAVLKKHRIEPQPKTESAPPAAEQSKAKSLQTLLGELADGLFTFLGQVGENKMPSLAYIIKVHNLFVRDWYPRLEGVAYELGIQGIIEPGFGQLLGDHHDAFDYGRIRDIAEALLRIKNNLELRAYKEVTLTAHEVDKMSSTALRRRIDGEAGFTEQVDTLEKFKRP